MPSTYSLISSNVLTSSAASVTFSAIPSTYTDLVVRVSAKSDRANANDDIKMLVNGSTSSVYGSTWIIGNGATPSSSRSTSVAYLPLQSGSTGGSTANVFSSTEVYIPNYTSAIVHPVGSIQVQEDNATTARISANAATYNTAEAITSLTFNIWTGPNFVSGSSFYLYGIKNS